MSETFEKISKVLDGDVPTACCTPTAEEKALLAAGDYTPEELWGGSRPACPKCIEAPVPSHDRDFEMYRDQCSITPDDDVTMKRHQANAYMASMRHLGLAERAYLPDAIRALQAESTELRINYTACVHGRQSFRQALREKRAEAKRLQAENAALQQRLNVADQRVDDLQSERDALKDENTLLRHDVASYLETMAKTCELLGIDLESAKTAEGNPSDVLFKHAENLSSELTKARELLTFVVNSGGFSYVTVAKDIREFLARLSAPAAKGESDG